MTDDVPLWLDAVVLSVLGAINFISAAYESALERASRSRIVRLLEKRDRPLTGFLERASTDDSAVYMRVDLLYVLSTTFFLGYGLWIMLRNDPAIEPGVYAWEVVWVSLVLFLLRMIANPVGEYFSESLVIRAARLMAFLTFPFAPLCWLALNAERIFARAVGVENEDDEEEREADVIDAVSDGQLDGVVEDNQKEMIEGIFEFKDADVADIIVPRTEMTTVNADGPLADAIKLALEKGYSRLPAYRGNRDHIVGIFYLRDAFKYWDKRGEEQPALADLLHPPLFVPETKLIPELLGEMRRGQSHMAVVLDEYGGTAGLVTMEDVLEEIVGDIQDEFDSAAGDRDGKVRQMDNFLVADGNAHVAEINKLLGDSIIPEDDDYEPVAGFVLDNLGHIPKVGEDFVFEECLAVRVLQADERRVRRVRLQLMDGEE